jgi:hypothetical protein
VETKIRFQIGGGAKRSITNDMTILHDYVIVNYDTPQYIFTIIGESIIILGEGKLGKFPRVFFSPQSDMGVIAVVDLQNIDLVTVFPAGDNKGVVIFAVDRSHIY